MLLATNAMCDSRKSMIYVRLIHTTVTCEFHLMTIVTKMFDCQYNWTDNILTDPLEHASTQLYCNRYGHANVVCFPWNVFCTMYDPG